MLNLRTPKGTIDYTPKETTLMNNIITTTVDIYKLHGATCIDTPTFELKQILTNKYGDDSKLIFDLKDQGGDMCSLRYDLTVSFARYLAQKRLQKIKRYQIGKVFRRDQPAVTKGKLREFIQCDFDIAGEYGKMTVDAEIIKIASDCLEAYKIGKYMIKINHRKILAAIFTKANIPSTLHNTVCSTVDKVDKMSIEDIRREFKEKGINEEQIEIIERYIKLRGNVDFLISLRNDPIYKIESGQEAIEDLILLGNYLKCFNIAENVEFDLSLARGTDYYTEIIFEGVYIDKKVGAVCGGGRYDNLVGDFVKENGGKELNVPCVGFSVGLARIYALLKDATDVRESETMVFVGSSGGIFLEERMQLISELWESQISSETYYSKLNFMKQAMYCSKQKIPFMVILGEEEIKEGFVQVSITQNGENKKERVERKDLVNYLKDKIMNKNE